jgi:hypothetical protein
MPEAVERSSYGTPAWFVGAKGKLFARIREDPGECVVKVDRGEREAMVRSDPAVFYITPHYDNYDAVIVRLGAVSADELEELIVESWRRAAPKRLLAGWDREHPV